MMKMPVSCRVSLLFSAAVVALLAFGGLPSGYEAVDSISANGAQYIDTGVVAQKGLTADVTFMYTRNVTKCILGAEMVKLPTPECAMINRRYHVMMTFADSSGEDTLYLFARNNGGVAADFAWARISAVRLTLGDAVLRDFVSCKETASGKFGLYDRKEGVFYPSCGDKPFFMPLRVGVYGGYGGTGSVFELYRLVDRSPEVELVNISGEMAQEGSVFAGVDMIVMPGGSSKNEMTSLGAAGQANLVNYIRNGGSYYGTCAGSHLVLEDELNISGYKRTSYKESHEQIDIDLNEEGRRELGLDKRTWDMRYSRGPFITNGTAVAGANLRVWGTYTNTAGRVSESGNHLMEGKYAVLAGNYYDGKMLVVTSHPESNYQNFPFIRQAWRWLSGRDDITTETSALGGYAGGRTNVFYVGTYANGIYPIVETLLRADDDPRMSILDASGLTTAKYRKTARAFVADTAANAAPYQRTGYEAPMNEFKANGGLLLIAEDCISKDEMVELVDGVANDRRTQTSVPWDADGAISLTGDQTLAGLDLRVSTGGECVTTFSDGEISFAADENKLGGDWVYCAPGAVHRVVVNNAHVSAVYGNHRRDSFYSVTSSAGKYVYTPVASNRFEITLGARNAANGPAVLTFERDLVIAKNSTLAIDARWMPAGTYKIIEAGTLSVKEPDFVSKATVTADEGVLCGLRQEGNAIVLTLAEGSELFKVDYVESTGTQYVDTGICLQDKVVLDIDFEWVSRTGDAATYAGMFGVSHTAEDGQTYKCYLAYANSSQLWRCSLGTSAMTTLNCTTSATVGDRHHLNVTVNGKTVKQSDNGGTVESTSFSGTNPLATYPRTFYLGAVDLNGRAGSRWPSKIYSAKVYTNLTVLARDYRPCYRAATRTYGLYDMVTKTFHPSALGAFEGAALPDNPESVDPKPEVLPSVVCDSVTTRPLTNFVGSVVVVRYSTWDAGAGWKLTPTLTVGGHVYAGMYDAATQTATFVVPGEVARAGTIQTAVADVLASWTASPDKDVLSSATNRLVQGELRMDRRWFDERAATLGGTGIWTPVPGVSDGRIAIVQDKGERFTLEPSRPHEGTGAQIEAAVSYDGCEISGSEGLNGSQAACAIVPDRTTPGAGRFVLLLDGEWVTNGVQTAELGKTYAVRISLDYGTVPTAVAYDLKTDADEYVCLGSGHSVSTARQTSQVDVYGEGFIESLVGTEVSEWADASLVEAGGIRYETVESALAAGATDIRLLWDASAKPDPDAVQCFTVDKGGHELYLKSRRFRSVKNSDGTYTYTWIIPGMILYVR